MRIYSVLTFMAYCCLLKAFTITVPKDLYVVEYGSNVTLECRFPVDQQLNLLVLVVYWEMEDKKIIQFVNGKEDLNVQHSSYHGRAQLLKDQLSLGKAALQITDVKLQDAGVYCCLISYGGADYKRITLKVNDSQTFDFSVENVIFNLNTEPCSQENEVPIYTFKNLNRTKQLKEQTPYRKIYHTISVDPVTSEHELTCQAEGYPEADVIWTSSDHQVLSGKTSITNSKREEKLFNVTSTLRINTTADKIFYCTFRRLGHEENNTAELVIPEPYPDPAKTRNHLVILGALFLFLHVTLAVIFCLKRNVRKMDVEKCGTQDMNSKQQNATHFEET